MAVKTDATGKIQKPGEDNTALVTPGDSAKDSILGLLSSMGKDLERALPMHIRPDRMMRIATTAVEKNRDLLACTKRSFIGSLLSASQLGLEVNTPLGHAFLVPFNRRVKDAQGNWGAVKECQIIIGYQGYIDLVERSGKVAKFAARTVHEGDHFEAELGLNERLVHRPNWDDPDRDLKPLTFVYAIATRSTPYGEVHAFELLSATGVEVYRKRSNSQQVYDAQSKRMVPSDVPLGPWATDYGAMAKKTALRRLTQYQPKSAEVAQLLAIDASDDVKLRSQRAYSPEVLELMGKYGVDDEPTEGDPEE